MNSLNSVFNLVKVIFKSLIDILSFVVIMLKKSIQILFFLFVIVAVPTVVYMLLKKGFYWFFSDNISLLLIGVVFSPLISFFLLHFTSYFSLSSLKFVFSSLYKKNNNNDFSFLQNLTDIAFKIGLFFFFLMFVLLSITCYIYIVQYSPNTLYFAQDLTYDTFPSVHLLDFFHNRGYITPWKEPDINILTWISSGFIFISWGFLFDPLSLCMMFVICLISLCILSYSYWYMSHDPNKYRFFGFLFLFVFFMLVLVSANNFLQMFLGWEGVGVISFLLINFWNTRIQANKAAIKAMLMNRIGDFSLLLGILFIYFTFNSLEYSVVLSLVPYVKNYTLVVGTYSFDILTIICLLLFGGAMGKSAQIGLHAWLPDAMEGPTPVSALLHSATMVTAGVFLLIRVSPLLESSSFALSVITVVGGLTAIFAATIGLFQYDIKRVIAYSTCSQLGYMIFSCGVSQYVVSAFHLFNHAFFKALLFLCSGVIIHWLDDEQDIRRMGGLSKHLPFIKDLMTIASFSLMGFPFLSGFYSKDLILEGAFCSYTTFGFFAYSLGCISAFFTSLYSFRLLYFIFFSDINGFFSVYKNPSKLSGFEISESFVKDIILQIQGKLDSFVKFFGFVPGTFVYTCSVSVVSFLSEIGDYFFYSRTVSSIKSVCTEVFFYSLPLLVLGLLSIFSGFAFKDCFFNHPLWESSLVVSSSIDSFEFMPIFFKLLPTICSFSGVFVGFLLYSDFISSSIKLELNSFYINVVTFFNRKWYFDKLNNLFFSNSVLYTGYSHTYQLIDRGLIEFFGPFSLTYSLKFFSQLLNSYHKNSLYFYVYLLIVSLSIIIWFCYFGFLSFFTDSIEFFIVSICVCFILICFIFDFIFDDEKSKKF